MKNKPSDNLTIKIISVLFAILLWLYIQMVQTPDIEYTFRNMNVDLVNAPLLEERNLVVTGNEKFTTDVTVKCPRWNLNEIKSKDFVPYVDLSEIRAAGTFELPVKVRLNNDTIIVSNKEPSTVKVSVEKIVTVEKDLVIHVSGNLKDGYYTNNDLVVPQSKVFSVKGPQSVINKIYNGVISVNIGGKSADFSDLYDIILVSEDGTAVSNDKLTILNNAVNVDVTVYKKKVLPVEINGVPANVKYDVKPSNVEVAGPNELLENMDKIIVNNFNLFSREIGYTQKIDLKLDDKLILLNDVELQLVVKEW